MSVRVMSRVWESSKQKANKLLALLALADNANDDGWAYPGQNAVARKCRMTKRGAQKLLDALETADEIVIYNRIDEKHPELHFTNVYHLPKYGNADAPPPQELRGFIKRRVLASKKGSEQPDTTVANSGSLPNEQPDTTVVNSGSPKPSVNPSLQSVDEPSGESDVSVVSLTDQDDWVKCLVQLESQFDRQSFETWIRGATLLTVERDEEAPPTFVIGVRNSYAQNMCQHRLYRTFARILSDCCGEKRELRFEVDLPKVDVAETGEMPLYDFLNTPTDTETIRELVTRFCGELASEEDEATVQMIEARYGAEDVSHALEVMAGYQARGKVSDPLKYTVGILRNQASVKVSR